MQINSRSQKRIDEILEYYHQYIDAELTTKKVVCKKKGDRRVNNSGYGYKRPIVVIRGKERIEFPSIRSAAHSQMFRCTPKAIRSFAEKRADAGGCAVYYKDQLPEELR